MATLNSLKEELRQKATAANSSPKQPLSDAQYSAGFEILKQGLGRATYDDFIIPQLTELLTSLLNSREDISVLEIGPGPKSVLGDLPRPLRSKIRRYVAFEPNISHATTLEEWLCPSAEAESPMPCLKSMPDIRRIPFALQSVVGSGTGSGMGDGDEKFDVILFCHSMYGMKPQTAFIDRALELLVERPEGGMVVVFHRDGNLPLRRWVGCRREVSFPTGAVSVADDDESLDSFLPFVAGFVMQDAEVDKAIRLEWRKACRALARREGSHPNHLLFSSPDVMMVFTQHVTGLRELVAQVPLASEGRTIKNWEARLHHPTLVVKPATVRQVQQCVQWALKHGASLTVVGGSHSAHCVLSNVVAVDMSALDQVHIITIREDGGGSEPGRGPLVVAEAGCKTGDIIRKTMAEGITVPLGSRPSVGAGLWLQGGIGHLARQHGLACDSIVGAVIIGVDSGQVFYVGQVPSQHRPAGAVRPENEADILWAIKGAGTNFGIVVSVTFESYAAPIYSVRSWTAPLSDSTMAQLRLSQFDRCIAEKLPRDCSADAYLYWDDKQLHLGVTMFESSMAGPNLKTSSPIDTILGVEGSFKSVDSVGLFETEMYMSGMHGGHGGGKTSSFKRCLFLKQIGSPDVVNVLTAAVKTCPSQLCYLHLLHGGGAVGDVAADATAFGCRDWDFACVITGVWPRDQDGTEVSQAAVQWVYNVVENLLPLSSGVYGADLGPDPRDFALATKAFGPNLPRLARLKRSLDPHNVLAYACPLPQPLARQKLIILVTGESCTGKDYCAEIWASVFSAKRLTARVVSISDATKREYATVTGAELEKLLQNRAYKEQHRPALTAFFQEQVRKRPRLPEEHFLHVVNSARDVDVLLVTGMRDEAPVPTLWHLVPGDRLVEVRVETGNKIRQVRRGHHDEGDDNNIGRANEGSGSGKPGLTGLKYRPSLIFSNDTVGDEATKRFADNHLVPFFHERLQHLADMIPLVPDFPRPGIEFRHMLNIAQKPGGLTLCASLLQTHFVDNWSKVGAVVCCEAGGFVFASALATRVCLPLVLIRKAGKLPPPTVSVKKFLSHISSSAQNISDEEWVEMDRDAIPKSSSVVVVDDVLATGETLCAVVRLLVEAGIQAENISVMVVAEFPVHRGRECLRMCGFGGISIQSLLVFGGV